jgi:hypothetical protein
VQAVTADAQKCLNLYPEVNESGDGRSKMILLNTPGLFSLAQVSVQPRGEYEFNGRLFVVGGTSLYEVLLVSPGGWNGNTFVPATVTTNILNPSLPLANDGLIASMAANENQLLISSGGSVYIYYLNAMNDSVTGLPVTAGTFAQVPASNFTLSTGNAPVKQIAFCDSYFLALIANSQAIQISNVLDGFNWIPGGAIVAGVYTGGVSSQIVVSVFPENIVGMIVDHREVWIGGSKKTVVYYASGGPDIFDVQSGGFIEQGRCATFAASQLDNSIMWIHQSERGDRMAWRMNGYTPTRISTHATEFAWKKYAKVSDAVSYSYEDNGHSFWVTLFPSANGGLGATWVYDTATGLWHERDALNTVSGASMGHPSWVHAYWQGLHIVGDWRSSNLYQMSTNFYDNAGTPIVRKRRAPHLSTELETTKHSRFELDIETGLVAFGQLPIVLQAANGFPWMISVLDTGLLQTVGGAQLGSPQVIKLNDSSGASWQVGVNNSGELTTTSITAGTYPIAFPIVSTTKGSVWNLQVTTTGLLQTIKTNTAIPTLPTIPLVWLSWSDDGGHTWSNPQPRQTGALGKYKTRVRWARLGRARIRTYEVTCSEAIPINIVDAYVNGAPGMQPSQRLTRQYQFVS